MNQNPWMLVNGNVSPPDVVSQTSREESVPCLFRVPLVNPRVVSKACFFCHIVDFSTTAAKAEFLAHGPTGWILLLCFPPQWWGSNPKAVK